MATKTKKPERINFRIQPDLKKLIEEAAEHSGQTVSDYAISTLVKNARQILEQSQVTQLSRRDAQRFKEIMDDADARPNAALKAAARKYKKQVISR